MRIATGESSASVLKQNSRLGPCFITDYPITAKGHEKPGTPVALHTVVDGFTLEGGIY